MRDKGLTPSKKITNTLKNYKLMRFTLPLESRVNNHNPSQAIKDIVQKLLFVLVFVSGSNNHTCPNANSHNICSIGE